MALKQKKKQSKKKSDLKYMKTHAPKKLGAPKRGMSYEP